ncbi:hypothetical protein VQL36_08790 [Chengkuizengella sp. SCS-71B]|uniref:hypothetical protein n=1 Tax=Chengkuizengella sp. SCS-71B TaxID=3115290 RepID=UPI0032C20E70
MSKEDIKMLYGNKDVELTETEILLIYLYNFERDLFYQSMGEYFTIIKTIINEDKEPERLKNIIQFSIGVGLDGLSDSLYMKDSRDYENVYKE